MTSVTRLPNLFERAAAERGASLLDKRMPAWHRQIDLSTLDIYDSTECVLGQLFKTASTIPYWVQCGYESPAAARVDHLAFDVERQVCDANYSLGKHTLELSEEDCRTYGFNADFSHTSYNGLDLAWAEIIRARQHPEKKE